jgi:hypothetical protein
MKITIESTTRIVEVTSADGGFTMPARIWEGVTESGIPVQCLMTRIAAPANAGLEQFARELQEHSAPQEAWQAFPLRMVL